jgi:transposase
VHPPTPPLVMDDGQRAILEKLAKSQSAPHRDVARAKALLLATAGVATTAIAAQLQVSPASVTAWRARFVSEGVARMGRVRTGRGRKPTIPKETVDEIVRLTEESAPPGGTHWSCRSMAQAAHVSPATVQRVWSARGLKPHLVKTFTLSTDPRFEERLIDVVGLYRNPPDQAVVLCMDEKSEIQALDRTRPSLSLKKGRAGTVTHDDKRHGATTLFAALNVLTGTVIGECLPRHRHEEFLTFLRRVNREVPKDLAVHLIVDNYATHEHADVTTWLAKHPRFHLHFTPTSSSWLHLVERWFREITDRAIRRGVFPSVPDLVTAIEAYLRASSDNPKPFVWVASADSILEKVRRGRVVLEAITN